MVCNHNMQQKTLPVMVQTCLQFVYKLTQYLLTLQKNDLVSAACKSPVSSPVSPLYSTLGVGSSTSSGKITEVFLVTPRLVLEFPLTNDTKNYI